MNSNTPLFIACLVALSFPAVTAAQAPVVHYQYGLELPPGAIGRIQTGNRPGLACQTQPIEVRVPDGALISIASDGAFIEPYASRLTAAIQVGPVYRLQVTQIPTHPTGALYPTVELMDRLHPPAGLERRYPIRIVLPQEDLDLALQGKLVTRVVYLEDPRNPFPFPERRKDQRYFDVLPDENPIQVADELGRPMAIVRIGSRIPDTAGPNEAFLFGSPPVSVYQSAEPLQEQPLAPMVDAVPRPESNRPSVLLPDAPTLPEPEPDTADDAEDSPSPLDAEPTELRPAVPKAADAVVPEDADAVAPEDADAVAPEDADAVAPENADDVVPDDVFPQEDDVPLETDDFDLEGFDEL